MGASTGPDITLFMKFKICWSQLEAFNYQSSMIDIEVANALQSMTKDAIRFCLQQIEKSTASK